MKLTVDGRSYTHPLIVKQDPRVRTPALSLNQLYTLMRGSYFEAADARAALDTARRLREVVGARRAAAPEAVKPALEAFDKRLEGLIGAPGPAGGRGGGRGATAPPSGSSLAAAVSALSALARELGAADVRPTAEQVQNIAAARETARRVMTRWQSLSTTELAMLNAALTKAGLSPIKSQ